VACLGAWRPGHPVVSAPHHGSPLRAPPAAARAPEPSGPPRARSAASAAPPTAAMKRNKLGSSDLTVSEVCLGTMTFGQQNTEAEGHAQMSRAVEAGVNFFDTAEIYPIVPSRDTQGSTSRIVGTWLRARGRRDDVIVASKVAGKSVGLQWVPANRTEPRGEERTPRPDGPSIVAACEAELRRLRTDYIDLFQIHWPDRYVPNFGKSQYRRGEERDATPFEEQVAAMGRLIDEGKIRHWALSNESTYGVAMHCTAADRLGVPRPVSIQNSFSLLHRSFEGELAEACSPAHFDLGLLPWSAMAGGALSGKYLDGAADPSWRQEIWPDRYQRFRNPRARQATARYAALARDLGVTPAQLAYAFCRTREFIPSTIIGATSMAQLEENLGAFAVELSDEALERIEEIHLDARNPSQLD